MRSGFAAFAYEVGKNLVAAFEPCIGQGQHRKDIRLGGMKWHQEPPPMVCLGASCEDRHFVSIQEWQQQILDILGEYRLFLLTQPG